VDANALMVLMGDFVRDNFDFVSRYMRHIGFSGHVSAVHFVPGWKYTGKKAHLQNKIVVGTVFDRHKGQWDFAGGKNESTHTNPVVQFLETLYKELYEETSAFIKAPLQDIVLEIILTGANQRSFLVVCGIQGLVAAEFVAAMQYRFNAVSNGRRVHPSFLETTNFMYLCMDDKATISKSTDYVQKRLKQVIQMVEFHLKQGKRFPAFHTVMTIQHGYH
jgi:hypothetical protein